MKLLLALAFITLTTAACSTPAPKPVSEFTVHDDRGAIIHREYLAHPSDPDKKIEFFWMKPEGEGPFPMVVLLHGHQSPERPGGGMFTFGELQMFVKQGWVAVAVSQPGYGGSNGPPDFCGPYSQDAVHETLRYFRSKSWIKPERIAISGASRGAILAAMVATQEKNLAGLILTVGAYDLKESYGLWKVISSSRALAEAFENEAGTSDDAFESRSALSHIADLRTPALIIASGFDNPGSQRQAGVLTQKLKAQGTPAELVDFPDEAHQIPFEKREFVIMKFLKERLAN